MNNTTDWEQCHVAEKLMKSTYFNVLLLVKVFLYLTGIIFCVTLSRAQFQKLAAHNNVHILLINHYISIVLQSVIMACGHAYDLVRFKVFDDPCDLVIQFKVCVFFRMVPLSCLIVTICSLGTMAVERLYASLKFSTYEKRTVTLGICLSVIQVIIFWRLPARKYEFSTFLLKIREL